jgi:hypothetical protein
MDDGKVFSVVACLKIASKLQTHKRRQLVAGSWLRHQHFLAVGCVRRLLPRPPPNSLRPFSDLQELSILIF